MELLGIIFWRCLLLGIHLVFARFGACLLEVRIIPFVPFSIGICSVGGVMVAMEHISVWFIVVVVLKFDVVVIPPGMLDGNRPAS